MPSRSIVYTPSAQETYDRTSEKDQSAIKVHVKSLQYNPTPPEARSISDDHPLYSIEIEGNETLLCNDGRHAPTRYQIVYRAVPDGNTVEVAKIYALHEGRGHEKEWLDQV